MSKCPHCQAILPLDNAPASLCSNCGKPFSELNLTVADVGATLDETNTGTVGASKIVEPSAKTVSDTIDEVVVRSSSAKTMAQMDATMEGTIDLSIEWNKVGDKDLSEIGATLATIPDQPNLSPMATIVLGPSGITVGGSNAALPFPPLGATRLGGLTDTGRGQTGKNTGNNLFDSGIDFDQSILSTISKRSLADGADPLVSSPDYRIISKLGEGGMGVVYSAIQKTLERKVAVKAIKSNKSVSDESRRKFFYEAQITSDLDHPNIVPIHEMGSNSDGTLFYSMKMVDGTPWENVIRDKTREENIEILMKVCDAIAFAHSRNIIHRDLKPENVMLGAFGEVLVMDWGLAINLSTTKSFGLSGTPVYMAPEMACHNISKIGKTSDIYIIGAILFQIVVGKAPHVGKSVRECMANAIKNNNIDPGFEDPLLDIAYHAMATEPEDRFATVLEFQDAIREHLRFSQSVVLTKRAEALLENAIRDKDYQGFSRALFSMQDAIDLWSDNEVAKEGLQQTRIAYGQCAIERGDYDLCLQTVDPSIDAEAELYKNATRLKSEVTQRATRVKLLRRVLAGVILVAGTALTLATVYARRQTTIAIQEKARAVDAAKAEKDAREEEAAAKRIAIDERNRAQQAAEDERIARNQEEIAKKVANQERDRAVEAQRLEQEAKIQEMRAREQAVASEQNAKVSEQKAIASEKVATQNARFALLGSFQSGINLALNQSNQFDVVRSEQLLSEISAMESSLYSTQSKPSLTNWAYRRIQLLNNIDLPRIKVDSPVTSLRIAANSKVATVGTANGSVHRIDLSQEADPLQVMDSIDLPAPIQAVAIAPDGSSVMIATQKNETNYSVHSWNTMTKARSPIEMLERRELQELGISPDGKWCIGGVNGGLWVWERKEDDSQPKPFLLDCRGKLTSLQFFSKDSSDVFGLAQLPNATQVAFLANLELRTLQLLTMPPGMETTVTAAASSPSKESIYLGTNDGRLLVAAIEPKVRATSVQTKNVSFNASSTESLRVVGEVLPKKHATAIREIVLHADGTMITSGDEPVAFVWKTENGNQVTYVSFLNGLQGNVTSAQFLHTSNEVIGCDNLGNIIRWNIANQEARRMLSSNTVQLLRNQSLSKEGILESVDRDGVLRSSIGSDKIGNAMVSYVGHTPKARLTDMAVGSSHPWVATVASLSRDSSITQSSPVANTEVCIWDLASQSMTNRLQFQSRGACRIEFTDGDDSLVVGDGEKTFMLSSSSGADVQVESRFGTSIAVAHPTQKSFCAHIASSGSVQIVDSTDASSWDNPQYREFDIAINSQYVPIEAAWSSDGKQLFIIFENGRIARLAWNGAKLDGLSWSDTDKSIQSTEQQEPWRFLDMAVETPEPNTDRVKVVVRSSDASAECNFVQLTWNRSTSKPVLDRKESFQKSVRIMPLEPDPVPESKMNLAVEGDRFLDIQSLSSKHSILVDPMGAVYRFDKNLWSLVVGRPPCLRAARSTIQERWVTMHELGLVMVALKSQGDQYQWQQVQHPFQSVTEACLSPDGKQLAIVGRLANQKSQLLRWNIDESNRLQESHLAAVDGIQFASWHPQGEGLLVLNQDGKWTMLSESGESEPLATSNWTSSATGSGFEPNLAGVQWLQEPWLPETTNRWHVAILSHEPKGSRIDFVSLDPSSNENFSPILSTSKITSFTTSPNENLLAIGDENGTLGVWFAAPSLDRGARELFTLPGHRGASIGQVSFSDDGNAILSSDINRKSILWKSAK